MSKGSKRRPEQVKGSYYNNYDNIFRQQSKLNKEYPGDNGSVIKPGGSETVVEGFTPRPKTL